MAWLKPSSILYAVELKWTGGAILLGAGGLTFIYDTAVFSNYSGAISDPDSDGGKARVLLKKRASSFLQPQRASGWCT
jgi:hypothetical protein